MPAEVYPKLSVRFAFGALGMAPSWRELALVAETVTRSGDGDAIATGEAAAGDDFDKIADIAAASGSSGFVALDLVTAIVTGQAAPVKRA